MELNFNYIDYLIQLKGNKRGAAADIARELNVKPQFISSLRGGKPIGSDLAKKLSDFYGDSIDFILTGAEGESKHQPIGLVNEADHPYKASITTKDKGVPYYDVDFIGGFELVFGDQTVNPSYYIDFKPFNNADYWINVTGKSMGPLIAHGDIVALKKVDDWQSFLVMGDIYAIVTSNNLRTIKILEAGEDMDHYLLVPYNDSHKTQPIPKKVITHVFKVIGCIKKFL